MAFFADGPDVTARTSKTETVIDWRRREPRFRSALEVKAALADFARLPVDSLILMRNKYGIPYRAAFYPKDEPLINEGDSDVLVFVAAPRRDHEFHVHLVWGASLRTKIFVPGLGWSDKHT